MVRAPRFRLVQVARLQAFLLAIAAARARCAPKAFVSMICKFRLSSRTSHGSHTFELEGLVVRPDDGQPHPLAVLNHGSPRDAEERPKMSPYGMWAQAIAFARRGWVAVAFMRRGYGHSQGEWAPRLGLRAPVGITPGLGSTEADDIAAVAKFMSGQAYVSKGRWISVGVSAGGFAIAGAGIEGAAGSCRGDRVRAGQGIVGARYECAAKTVWLQRSPNTAGPRACRCCGCRPTTIISSDRN